MAFGHIKDNILCICYKNTEILNLIVINNKEYYVTTR